MGIEEKKKSNEDIYIILNALQQGDEYKNTILHYAVKNKHEKTVKLLLKTFDKEYKEKLIAYVLKENLNKNTSLCFALQNADEKILNLLFNAFCEDENEKLIEYLMKENKFKYTILHYASY